MRIAGCGAEGDIAIAIKLWETLAALLDIIFMAEFSTRFKHMARMVATVYSRTANTHLH
jgi:hypothetical protein